MRVNILHSASFEQWDFRSLDTGGIGGSETSQVEMAWRLAERQHDVWCYALISDDCPREDRGVHWRSLEDVDFEAEGAWIVYRDPRVLENLPRREGRVVWLVCQDVDYPDSAWTKESCENVDRVIALCPDQGDHLAKKHPGIVGRVWLSSNGVRCSVIAEIEKEGHERNPKRLMFSSSPDRGLENLLPIFRRAREFVPDLELHVYYGLQGIQLGARSERQNVRQRSEKVLALVSEAREIPGVTWHGRIGQKDLYREWFKTGIWCHPTDFTETSCITCMDAQSLGAIPLTRPLWALRSNVKFGGFIEGNPSDPLVRARYVDALVKMANSPEGQDQIRERMMMSARGMFNWSRIVDQWERWLYEFEFGDLPDQVRWSDHHAFSHRHVKGEILNVGCDTDSGGFRFRGAVNLDYAKEHPYAPGVYERHVDVVADARDLPHELDGKFDSVVLGEILEHMSSDDAVKVLEEAKRVLRAGGSIIITWPEEDGSVSDESCRILNIMIAPEDSFFAPDCPAHHYRTVTYDEMKETLARAGLEIEHQRVIEYMSLYTGWGVVVKEVTL